MDDDGFIDWLKPLYDEFGVSVEVVTIIDHEGYLHDRLSGQSIRHIIGDAVTIDVGFVNPARRDGLPYTKSFNSWGQPISDDMNDEPVPLSVTNYDASMEPAEGDEIWGLM